MTASWCYLPFKRLFCPDDAFFEEGNIQCNLQRKQINCLEIEDISEWSSAEFKCSVIGCKHFFSSIQKYEVHYRGCHWNSCRYCKKSFQTSFLLDLHILENHDTLFQMIAKRSYMYRCLVEACPDKFGDEDGRKKHLVQVHKYPSDFRFNRPSRAQRKNRAPKTICFGRGSSRGFQRGYVNRGKKKNKKSITQEVSAMNIS